MKNWIVWLVLALAILGIGIGVYAYGKDDESKGLANKGFDKPDVSGNSSKPGNTGIVPPTMAFAQMGMKGQAVKDVQVFINSLGYTPKLAEDSNFGPQTQAAVTAVFGKPAITMTDWEQRKMIRYAKR